MIADTCCYHGSREEDAVCCICAVNPCDGALDDRARKVLTHAEDEKRRLRAAHEREVAHVLSHGEREPLPW